jgi:hypothetical protein
VSLRKVFAAGGRLLTKTETGPPFSYRYTHTHTHTHLHQHRLGVALPATCTQAAEEARNVEVSMYIIATIRYERAKDGTHLPKSYAYDFFNVD